MDEQTEPALGSAGDLQQSALDGAGRFNDVLTYIEAGGPVVMILIAMSVFALAIILLKLWQFQSTRIGERRQGLQAVAFYRQGRVRKALQSLQNARSPLSQVISLAIQGRSRGDVPERKVREEVMRYGNSLLEDLRSGFRPLEVIASLAPLLGLFGTVLGMIEAFRQLEQAGNQVNPAILSGGIWAALLTTAAGLAVAIPVVAILNWLERRVERTAHAMEDAITQVFTESLAGGLEGSPADNPANHDQEGSTNASAGIHAIAAGE
ncbi:MotA/TolQ/ExbB proton channel family protein [Denitrobaculum tricleocarpae]|uniref:MotA/TolQ/ExbB proton channel family protein n=1 Tax=Denitrobaculum tricleocarpae TaxID=2591009 RepID=A0A545TGP5_9PROT|nr:MotA/TolQ/ExbB proton channel family protein [Denitrobaculum tricleocarpae]TQV76301.1 MotA/TolQ/ExbB proton channel family protein [Denitrobaculum tricleocarpae]